MGAGQSSPSPTTSSSPSSTTSTSSSLSLSPASPSKLCEFSKQEANKFKEEIKLLEDSIYVITKNELYEKQVRDTDRELRIGGKFEGNFASVMFHLPTTPFNKKHELLQNPIILHHPFIIKHILCLELVDILTMYRKTLQKIIELCEKCQMEEDEENVDGQVNEIMRQFEEGLKWFNLFIENFDKGNFNGEEYGTMLKNKLFQITIKMNKRFENIKRIKSEMKAICEERDELREARRAVYSGRLFGGNGSRSRYRSKKRKQIETKKSKPLSKTKIYKKKHNGKSVKK